MDYIVYKDSNTFLQRFAVILLMIEGGKHELGQSHPLLGDDTTVINWQSEHTVFIGYHGYAEQVALF